MALRKILAAIAIAVMASTAPIGGTAEAAGELQELVSRGVIRVGYINSPPSTIKDPRTGALSGVYVDGAKEIIAQTGLKVEWVETTWGTFAAGLQSGQFDLCIAGTFATIKRSMAVDFTKPIFFVGYSAIVAKDSKIKALEDMNKPEVKVAVIQGGAAEDFARRNLPKATLVTLGTGNLLAPFIEVASGRADAGIEDANTADHFAKQQPSVKDLYGDDPFNFLPIAWTVRKGNQELLSVINTGIDALMVSGKWAEMARAYQARGRFVDAPVFKHFPGTPK